MAEKRRVALLVGINDYWFGGWPRLEFAEGDCYKLAKALCRPQYGFSWEDVHILTGSNRDPSGQPFRNNLLFNNLFAKIADEPLDLFVFFFAGHGEELDGLSYLVPVDGVRGRIRETCVPLSSVVERVSELKARHKLMIFDICHSAGLRGKGPGLPSSFASEAQAIRDAVVLSACDVGEYSYEDRSLGGGVFTHFWHEALRDLSSQDVVSVFDVQRYAEGKVIEWARRNGVSQRPLIWALGTPTIYLAPPYLPEERMPIPSFLADAVSRTEAIVRALRRVLLQPISSDYCIRICARLSSFAVSEDEPEDPLGGSRYRELLLEERDALVKLFERGASLKVVLSWNFREYLTFPDASISKAEARLRQLRKFCRRILADEDLTSRATFVKVPIRERNLLFLGSDYLFEGRKLRVRGGFDATQVITDPEVIRQEVEMFDALFEDALDYMCRKRDLPVGRSRNRRLIEELIKDIDEDLRELESL